MCCPRDGAVLISRLDATDPAAHEAVVNIADGSLRGSILLAEDGEDNQELLGGHLRAAGADVTIAPNGRVAVNLAKARHFDLILMDMQMPELDGYGAATELRAAGLATPIVALTANAMAEDRRKCLDAGCTEYLAKPVERQTLLEMASRFLVIIDDAGNRGIADDQTPIVAIAQESIPAGRRGGILPSAFATDPKYARLLERFVARLPDRVSKLTRLARAGDLAGLKQAVHQLKGAGHGYGFAALTAHAARAEDAIKSPADLASVEAEVNALIDLIRRVDGYNPTFENAETLVPRKVANESAA